MTNSSSPNTGNQKPVDKSSAELNEAAVEQQQPLIQHLIELRDRILKSVLVVLAIFLGLYYFANDFYLVISEPLRVYLPEGTSMIATDVASPFLTPFKLTLVMAIFLAMPFILFQFWRFVAPALYKHEKQLAIPLLISSVFLFYLGVLFAYYVVFPLVFGFFTSAGPEGVTVMTDISKYLDFVLKLFFAFGLAFEIPIATVIMVATGATSSKSLSNKRPYIVVGCFVVGMLLTPPDVISQTLLAVPMWLLFEIGVFFSRMVENRNPPEHEEENRIG
ncbi:twin-arginine translocase subunit TatC [Alkalimarinus coralli]|uniref:twin-arginine translocase subunit TatC n=1 Tax=Alkalimarinus coralli TaxID=2935863 RepID=UPI00202B6FAB|nr:twin-arginine translocase subunit TatC [Alkalimarinus coralli]